MRTLKHSKVPKFLTNGAGHLSTLQECVEFCLKLASDIAYCCLVSIFTDRIKTVFDLFLASIVDNVPKREDLSGVRKSVTIASPSHQCLVKQEIHFWETRE